MEKTAVVHKPKILLTTGDFHYWRNLKVRNCTCISACLSYISVYFLDLALESKQLT